MKDVIGKRYGRLVIIGEVPKEERNCSCRVVICQCDCGNIKNIRLSNLTSGNTSSCGCFAKENARKLYERPVIGMRFGRLVGESTYYDDKGIRHAICICDCGNHRNVRVSDLFSGMTRSCGCLRAEASHDRTFEDITGQTFNELTAIKRVEDYISPSGNRLTQWLFRCSCGKEEIALVQNVKSGKKKSCGHIRYSYAEYQILNFLQKNNIRFEYNAKLEGLINPDTSRPLFVDFIIYRDDSTFFILEHQGEQHFYPDDKGRHIRGKVQREITDQLKKEYCSKYDIPLYETLYNEDYMFHLKCILHENNISYKEGDEEDGSDDQNG